MLSFATLSPPVVLRPCAPHAGRGTEQLPTAPRWTFVARFAVPAALGFYFPASRAHRRGRKVRVRAVSTDQGTVATVNDVDLSDCYIDRLGAVEGAKLAALRQQVPSVVSAANDPPLTSIWGVDIITKSVASDIILLKFLRAAKLDVDGAATRLKKTLRHRAEQRVDTLALVDLPEQFQGHDVIAGPDVEGRPVLFSRYGQMDNDRVFGDVNGFIKYRLCVMEQAMSHLRFESGSAETLCQVHDYSGVPLLFKTSEVSKAVNEMAKVFGDHYPETKGTTIFVNFPALFARMFQAFSVFIPERTRNKFLIFSQQDHVRLFEQIPPHAVPEDFGGLLTEPPSTITGHGQTVLVQAQREEELLLIDVDRSADVLWELRVCSGSIVCELVFVPAAAGREIIIQLNPNLKGSDGVVSGRYHATQAGSLKCRFTNSSWFADRVCAGRADYVQ